MCAKPCSCAYLLALVDKYFFSVSLSLVVVVCATSFSSPNLTQPHFNYTTNFVFWLSHCFIVQRRIEKCGGIVRGRWKVYEAYVATTIFCRPLQIVERKIFHFIGCWALVVIVDANKFGHGRALIPIDYYIFKMQSAFNFYSSIVLEHRCFSWPID